MAAPPPDFEPTPALAWLRKYIWVVAAVLGIVTLTVLRTRLRNIPDPPAVMYTLPAYDLVDQEGRPFTPETLRGKVWVAGFVFTNCPSTCPAVTRAMGSLRDRFDRMDIDIEMVSFTVDPARDTPAVLKAYAESVGAHTDHWRFVTGSTDDVRRLVREGFKLGIGDPTPVSGAQPADGGAMFDIAHSTQLALVDTEGGVRGFYDIEPDGGLDEVFHRAQHVMAEAARAARAEARSR
jgi:protein SCO1/2